MAGGEGRQLRVLAADDSAVMREVLGRVLQAQAGPRPMELCGVARDGEECLAMVERLRPDALVLDLEMPRLDGLGVLRRLKDAGSLLPVILCSAHTERGARSTLEALALGAEDYVLKPWAATDARAAEAQLRGELMPRLLAVAERLGVWAQERVRGAPGPGWAGVRASGSEVAGGERVEVVVVGLSTGGPAALEAVLPRLARGFPVPVVIAQHMPKLFTGALAVRLDRLCGLRVREAYTGAVMDAGTVWLAPGGAHLEMAVGAGGERRMRLIEAEGEEQGPASRCRPSVDRLFCSVAGAYGAGTLGVVMTGMGSDGLEGARAVRAAGGRVLAQDQASSAVWGMPGQVARAGLAEALVPLAGMAEALTARVAGRDGVGRIWPGQDEMPMRREVLCGLL